MVISIGKMATEKHIPKGYLQRTGLWLLFLLLALTFTACSSTTYREIPKPMPAYNANDVFDKIDTDGNKKIDRQEYIDAVSKSFDKLDKNKDAYLDREEFKATGIPDSDKLFDELDTNKDGKISKDELVKHHEKLFTIMDKNYDGFIDKNELNQYWEEEGVNNSAPPLIKPFIILFDF